MEPIYTTKTTELVYDPEGNIVDFSSLLSQKAGLDQASAALLAQVQAIFASVPENVPQEVVDAFGLANPS